MDPAQELHPDRRVLAGLHPSAQTLPIIPQITGNFPGGAPTLNVGATPGLPQQGFCQCFQHKAQMINNSLTKKQGKSSKDFYTLLSFPTTHSGVSRGPFNYSGQKNILCSRSLAHTLAYFLSCNCRDHRKPAVLGEHMVAAAATPGDLWGQQTLRFPGHPRRIYSPMHWEWTKTCCSSSETLWFCPWGGGLQTQITFARRNSHSWV